MNVSDLFINGNLASGVSAAGIFDGIDIDWEFPAATDTVNATLLMQEFRKQLDALGKTNDKHYLLTMFGPAGHAYVYFIYGMHFCINVSGERHGVGAGVLLRALEPIEGVAIMQTRRRVYRLADLTRGPGRLAEAMAIDRRLDGIDLCSASPLWLASELRPRGRIATSARIGISKETTRLLRFYEAGNPHVSGPLALRK